MADHHDASPRKRERAPIEEFQSQSKKPKLSPPPRPPPPVVRLTRKALKALRELNRRNKEAARSVRNSKPKRPGSPVPRYAAADLPACSASDLKRFAQHGGPDLSDLRGCHEPAVRPPMSSSVSTILGRWMRGSAISKSRTGTDTETGTTATATSRARARPYDHTFEEHLIKFNVYPDAYEDFDGQSLPEPDNLDEVRRALAQEPRRSLSPSRSLRTEFQQFRRADASASTESLVTILVIPIIQGDIGDTKCIGATSLFNNLDHLTDGSIVPAKPDLYYGARLAQLDERVCTELAGSIIPSTRLDLPIVPNFFLEVRDPNGSLEVAERQACHNGALGARGMQHLLSYGASDLVYDNKAYTLTCTYHGGTLDMYTTHVMPPARPGGRSRYVMTLVCSYSLKGGPDMFRAALTAYRNGRDWAERQRNEAIEQANMRAQVAFTGVGIGVGASTHPGKTYGRALEVASIEGDKEVVKMLLDKGADVNAQGGDYDRALRAASGEGHKEIVKMLLDKGADVNAQDGYYGTALQAASGEGYKEIVKMLLDKGADVNAQGGYYGTALQAASGEGHKEVVEMLLDKSADVNAQGGDYGTALWEASEGGHKEVVGIEGTD